MGYLRLTKNILFNLLVICTANKAWPQYNMSEREQMVII